MKRTLIVATLLVGVAIVNTKASAYERDTREVVTSLREIPGTVAPGVTTTIGINSAVNGMRRRGGNKCGAEDSGYSSKAECLCFHRGSFQGNPITNYHGV